MRILFSSDLHGNWHAINAYADELAKPGYDIGILSGDILDDGIPDTEMDELYTTTDLEPDDFLAELPGAEEPYLEYLDRQIALFKDPNGPFLKSLQIKEQRVREKLSSAGILIFLVPGNHDQTPWHSDTSIFNLHDQRLDHDGFNLVGYRWTELDRSEHEHQIDMERLATLIDPKTIFVTHRPALGYLDQGTDSKKVRSHIGSREIGSVIDRNKPLIHLFGHVHSGFGYTDFRVNGAFPRSRSFFRIDISRQRISSIEAIPVE